MNINLTSQTHSDDEDGICRKVCPRNMFENGAIKESEIECLCQNNIPSRNLFSAPITFNKCNKDRDNSQQHLMRILFFFLVMSRREY